MSQIRSGTAGYSAFWFEPVNLFGSFALDHACGSSRVLAKGDKIGRREVEIARRWHHEGLLSEAGLQAVEAAK